MSIDVASINRYRLSMIETEFIHPGVLVRQYCLQRFNLSVTEGAQALGVSRQALTNLLGGRAAI